MDELLPVEDLSTKFFTKGYLLINTTGTASDLRKVLKNTQDPKPSNSGVWTTQSFQSSLTTASFTLCFSNPFPWNYDVDISAHADGKEP